MIILQPICAEIEQAGTSEARSYLLGALRDGTFNRTHKTIRIFQKDKTWLEVLQRLIAKLGKRSWIYREGNRNVWVIESTCQLRPIDEPPGDSIAFVRGYFDAEGGLPRRLDSRLYIQFVQKDYADLSQVRQMLLALGIKCGAMHNPSKWIDPDYWRFYVAASSQKAYIELIRSWHPRKRGLLDSRVVSVLTK